MYMVFVLGQAKCAVNILNPLTLADFVQFFVL